MTHVINYDLPEKSANYVHRIGRTGRGFNKGIAVSFCSPEEKSLLQEIEELLKKKIEVIRVSKVDYKMITEPIEKELSLQEMIEHEENLIQSMKRKKKR